MTIYVDGACSGNGSEHSSGGFGVVVIENGKVINCYSHFENNTTNNRQELKAILWTLLQYGKMSPAVKVYSDSNYSIQTYNSWMYSWAKNGWIKSDKKIPENLDLIQTYYDFVQKGYNLVLEKVSGHSGVLGNELADKLATGSLTPQEVLNKYGK